MSGGAGLVFKGSGFYITDYGKDGKKDQRTAGAARKRHSHPAESAVRRRRRATGGRGTSGAAARRPGSPRQGTTRQQRASASAAGPSGSRRAKAKPTGDE